MKHKCAGKGRSEVDENDGAWTNPPPPQPPPPSPPRENMKFLVASATDCATHAARQYLMPCGNELAGNQYRNWAIHYTPAVGSLFQDNNPTDYIHHHGHKLKQIAKPRMHHYRQFPPTKPNGADDNYLASIRMIVTPMVVTVFPSALHLMSTCKAVGHSLINVPAPCAQESDKLHGPVRSPRSPSLVEAENSSKICHNVNIISPRKASGGLYRDFGSRSVVVHALHNARVVCSVGPHSVLVAACSGLVRTWVSRQCHAFFFRNICTNAA
ncbi:hypothetical protein BaRGS_00025494 [Batillaria attramentaria]|uniref:Uncharacterized protein n=1 Tax=Batillaria attramentaria TaxID=370345 RepID=A0ABD0K8C1_9CAEN